MLCRTAVLEVSSARGVFTEKVKANTLSSYLDLGYIKVTSKPLRLLPVWVGADLGVRVFECGWALHAWGKGAANW